MLSKEKKFSLSFYKQQLMYKLLEPTPPKHAHRPKQYKEFLERELKAVTLTLDQDKLESAPTASAKA